MDRIFAGRVARLLLGDPGRWWCPQEARELRQPVNDGGRGRRRQCSKSRQELRGPPRLPRPRPRRGSRTRRLDTFADDGHFLPSNLISGSAIWIKPSPRAVEESVRRPTHSSGSVHSSRDSNSAYIWALSATPAQVDRQSVGLVGHTPLAFRKKPLSCCRCRRTPTARGTQQVAAPSSLS